MAGLLESPELYMWSQEQLLDMLLYVRGIYVINAVKSDLPITSLSTRLLVYQQDGQLST